MNNNPIQAILSLFVTTLILMFIFRYFWWLILIIAAAVLFFYLRTVHEVKKQQEEFQKALNESASLNDQIFQASVRRDDIIDAEYTEHAEGETDDHQSE